jgi:protein phosphatase 1 regulatory subunit 11
MKDWAGRAVKVFISPSSNPKTAGFKSWVSDCVTDSVCCIYHAPRNIDSSSDESSSDSSSDESGDDGGAKPASGSKRNGRPHNHDHDHGDGEECKGHGQNRSGRSGKIRNRSPNAYEKMPGGKGKGKE